jgi:hypothetical protein
MKQARIYDFDPAQLAQIETDMWRAYYDRRPLALFRLSVNLVQEQLAFNLPQAIYNAYRLTRAAFVFKRGKVRQDYLLALPWLVAFYRATQRRLNGQWDPQKVAELELEWWIIHRHDFGPGNMEKLEQAVAELNAALYHLPVAELNDYASHRAQAMLYSDAAVQAREKGLNVPYDAPRIYAELEISYNALSACLKETRAAQKTNA